VQALVCVQRVKDATGHWQSIDNKVVLPARAIFVATGAQPNVAYEFEHRGHFQRVANQIFQYQPHQQVDGELQAVAPAEHCKDAAFGAFTSYQQQDKRVSFIGDTHPVFHGSVVKAIASGMRTYPHIVNLFPNPAQGDVQEYAAFRAKMQDLLSARVLSVQRHRPNLVEISVRAPLAAKQYQAGQFFRVQNFETAAPVLGNTRLQTEAMAMLGAKVDAEAGTINFLVSEYGASSRLFATLKAGDPLSVMGPTGAKTPIPKNETVMIIGERLGAIEMLSLAPVLKAAGNRVLYVACLQTADELFSQSVLESCSNAILWVTASGEKIAPQRPQDCSYSGDLETALSLYASGELSQGLPPIALESVSRVLIMGSTQLMRKVQHARHTGLKAHFSENTQFTASVHSTMQCMLKGVCAQCLQWQIDPVTKQRTKAVFACSWQSQPIDIIDIDNLDERLSQNHLQERLANLWLDYLFKEYGVERV
jgi:NAD(P)H-flavin reductase